MKDAQVQSVVAAGVAEPALLARWLHEPELLREYDIDPASLDLHTLWKFTGLITKVRNSCLRADFPLTFRLLSVTGIEIELFAHYSLYQSSIPAWSASSTPMKAQHLLNFIEKSLEPTQWPHALLWDVIRHENALMRLRGLTIREGRPCADSWTAASVPRISGDLFLYVMRSDPREVAAQLQKSSPALEDIRLGSFHFGYWRASLGNRVRVLEMDELGFYLLSLVDGEHCAMELCRKLTGNDEYIAAILGALGELGSLGILSYDSISRDR